MTGRNLTQIILSFKISGKIILILEYAWTVFGLFILADQL